MNGKIVHKPTEEDESEDIKDDTIKICTTYIAQLNYMQVIKTFFKSPLIMHRLTFTCKTCTSLAY